WPVSVGGHHRSCAAARFPHRPLVGLQRRAAPRVHNGLLLSALWDAAFDWGLVSFADNGSVLASSQLSETSRRVLDLDNISPLTGLRDAHRANLALHRARNGF